MSEPPKCRRCQGGMKAGYIPDASYNAVFVSQWVEGIPQTESGWLAALRKGWFGPPLSSSNLKGKSPLAIVTYRCTSCGLLESYAPST
jgi:hypothetical protein